MRLPPPHFFDFFSLSVFCGQGQFKDCSIVRWAEVESKGYLAVLDRGGGNWFTFLACVDICEIEVKSTAEHNTQNVC